MDKTITFLPDRAYEVTGIWVRDGRGQELNDYFAEIFPLAASEYGVRPLFGLEPISAHAGDFVPDVMFVNEWPSLESFQDFVADERVVALFPRRDALTERLVVTHYRVPAESSVTLQPDDVVEYAAMWIEPGKEQELADYYQEAVVLARENGLEPMTPLSAVHGYRGDFMPDRAALNLWRTKDNFDRFAASAAALFPRRNAALDRLEVTHARVRFDDVR